MNIKNLIGKTIRSIKHLGLVNYDDEPYLDIEFTDGTQVRVIASYGGNTGNSLDEYPSYIIVEDFKDKDKEFIKYYFKESVKEVKE